LDVVREGSMAATEQDTDFQNAVEVKNFEVLVSRCGSWADHTGVLELELEA